MTAPTEQQPSAGQRSATRAGEDGAMHGDTGCSPPRGRFWAQRLRATTTEKPFEVRLVLTDTELVRELLEANTLSGVDTMGCPADGRGKQEGHLTQGWVVDCVSCTLIDASMPLLITSSRPALVL
ncbi:MAG: hypothetical protein U0165_14495 [Polyangiaceae bacterium]